MSIQPQSESANRSGNQIHAPSSVRPSHSMVAVGTDPTDRHQRLTMIVLAFWLIGMACLFAGNVQGQEKYKSVPMNRLSDAVVKRMMSDVKTFATGGETSPYVVGYFNKYVPAVLTNDDFLPIVSKTMIEYHDILDRAERSGTNLNTIQGYAFRVMKAIASENYPPAARINAITVLSRIDSRPANPSARTPPVPLESVLPVLVQLYQDKKNDDGVRAAALHGIHRHVNYGFQRIAGPAKAGLTTMMMELMDSEPPTGRSADAHAYLQRFAVDILEKLRSKGDTALGEKLVSISTESNKPSLIALYSAANLGPIGGDMKGKISDPSQVLHSWSRRFLMELKQELARLEAFDRPPDADGQPQPPESDSTAGGGNASSTSGRAKKTSGFDGIRNMASPIRRRDDDENRAPAPRGGFGALSEMGGIDASEGRQPRGRRPATRKPETIPGENQPFEVLGSRRKLNHALQQLHLGATGSPIQGMPTSQPGGLLASTASEFKPEIQEWLSRMQDLMEQINDEELTTRTDYLAALEVQIELLQQQLGDEPAASPATPPADGPNPPNGVNPAAPAAPPAPAVDELGKL